MATTRNRQNAGRIRSAVNVILNGLVREGIIAGFETKFGANAATASPPVRVVVLAGSATDPGMVRFAVAGALERFGDEVMVEVKAG